MNKQFSLTIENTLYEITEAHPETIDVFVSRGFPQMGDEEKRLTFGKSINLKTALMLKGINSESFLNLLRETVEGISQQDVTLLNGPVKTAEMTGETLSIMGLLPCPVRIPLMENFEKFASTFTAEKGIVLNYQLQAASLGLEWVEEHILGRDSAEELPDLFLSAGFDLFFDEEKFGHFRKSGVFKDLTDFDTVNSDFEGMGIIDPEGLYSIIGAVPAVFLVNTEELGGRKVPESWEEILKPEFENTVSLPVGDFDLFNAILLNIYKNYGPEGVRKLGRSLLEDLHPSQMVKSATRKGNKPVVTIMPSFFTRMTGGKGPLISVWPKDGAIISPIFMLSRADKARQLKPVVDFFASKDVGEILAHQGRFPSLRSDVDNRFEESNYMWIGWDFIRDNDIGALIRECMDLFEESSKEPAQ
ncbi:ABC transporter substrate-binding protein [Spirochaeta isovalerica]|uniref:ABC-type Fe3+ transport system substrate-binding protein n=1 Tax=Spirochaeta isovalerica TaxID=150 RepID=A0A841RHT5_9SPIO|nr:ABC transporter substrate-binding protein [Spirochaeta isovalerica]MBB6482098.1 ABC-type Fe3+ transport system substrate-binding protein [Spirochaeta isovalerica]